MTHADSGEARVSRRGPTTKSNSITSAELIGNGKELIILHADAAYFLRITSNGKLILTK